jgi:hypothetical protein
MKRVVVHIDRLALHGVRREDRSAVGEALRRELTRQLARPHTAQDLAERRDAPRIRIGQVAVRNGAKPAQLGSQLGRGIARGLQS